MPPPGLLSRCGGGTVVGLGVGVPPGQGGGKAASGLSKSINTRLVNSILGDEGGNDQSSGILRRRVDKGISGRRHGQSH